MKRVTQEEVNLLLTAGAGVETNADSSRASCCPLPPLAHHGHDPSSDDSLLLPLAGAEVCWGPKWKGGCTLIER